MKTALIPRNILFGNPDRAAVRISPDGRFITFLAPVDGVLNVWVAPCDDVAAAKPITHDQGRGIQSYRWAFTNEHILYIQDKNGDENWHLYAVEIATLVVQNLTPLPGVQAQIHKVSAQFPQEIMVGLNDRSPQLHDLYRINILNGERKLVQENKGFVSYVSDDNYEVRVGDRMLMDGSVDSMRKLGEDQWESWAEIPMEDSLTTRALGFNVDGQLYAIDSRGRDKAALTAVDLESGAIELLFSSDDADVSAILQHPVSKKVQAAAVTYMRKQWTILDPDIAGDWELLENSVNGDPELISRSLDDRLWIVAYLIDDGGIQYYLFNRANQALLFLFVSNQQLAEMPLVSMHPLVIQAEDGLNLVSYLTFPPGTELIDQLKPMYPQPLVLLVHGGPWARDNWGYSPLHQWLANRGYTVLSVNFRGSTGFGKQFLNAGSLEWGKQMHQDLIDAVDWAINHGVADPEKVAIMGGSYGGYAALAGLTFTPEKFCCAVDIVGPSNLITLLESLPPYWQPMIELFAKRVGDPRTEAGRALLRERSPLTHVDAIKRPLLIGQGANDPRVKQAESDQIVAAMQAKGIPVTYVLYPDEGHGFVRPENRLSFFGVTEMFLAKIMGGRAELLTREDLVDSSIAIVAGGDHTPGLHGVEGLPT